MSKDKHRSPGQERRRTGEGGSRICRHNERISSVGRTPAQGRRGVAQDVREFGGGDGARGEGA
jgi:hypothetical protein